MWNMASNNPTESPAPGDVDNLEDVETEEGDDVEYENGDDDEDASSDEGDEDSSEEVKG